MIRNLFYPGRNWNLKSRNLAEKKFDYKFRLARNIHEENCLKSENIGDIASSYDSRSQVDRSAVFDAQYESYTADPRYWNEQECCLVVLIVLR